MLAVASVTDEAAVAIEIQALGEYWMAAVLCVGEIGSSVLVVPPGWDTVTVRFFTLIHYSLYADVAVLALGLMGLSLAAGAIVARPWRGGSA